MRNVLLLCLMAVLATHIGMSADILSSGNTANIPETGVPQELARWRKATYTDVRYRLHFDIPEERTERVDGWITVRIKLDAPADIVLDFREPASSVHEVSINGTLPQPCCFIQNEHIVIPAALTRAGENTVEALGKGIDRLLLRTANLAVVTNEIFSDGIRYDASTELYLRNLGTINQAMAARADLVTEVVYGIPVPVKVAADREEEETV